MQDGRGTAPALNPKGGTYMKKALLLILALAFLFAGCGKSGELQGEIDSLRGQLEGEQAALDEAQAQLDECREQLSLAQAELENTREQLAGESTPDFGECCRMVYKAHCDRFDELVFYDFLSQDIDDIFSDYDESERQCISSINSTLMSTAVSSIYYWKDVSGLAAPEDAARELVTMMLEEVKAYPDKSFTLDGYTVKDVRPSDRYDLLLDDINLVWSGATGAAEYRGVSLTRDIVESYIDLLFPVYGDLGYGYRCDSLALALSDNMWVFTPQYSYSFTGVCTGAGNSYVEDGQMVDIFFPDTCDRYYILIRNGDVWRMQSYNGISMLDSALKSLKADG